MHPVCCLVEMRYVPSRILQMSSSVEIRLAVPAFRALPAVGHPAQQPRVGWPILATVHPAVKRCTLRYGQGEAGGTALLIPSPEKRRDA